MKSIVVYESAYGNTKHIAEAMCAALNHFGKSKAIRSVYADPCELASCDLLLVGSPTQKFKMLPSMELFLNSIPAGTLAKVKAAAFDTRIDLKKVNNRILNFFVMQFGYAAGDIDKRLKARGGISLVKPEGFFVDNTEGPITAGEIERATAWVHWLGSQIFPTTKP